MLLGRREFLTGALGLAAPSIEGAVRTPKAYFGLHPFIESNPKAVFIKRTRVPHKMDEAAKLREGVELAREVFRPLDKPGVPCTHRIVLKPNSTSVPSRRRGPTDNWGTGTDPQFYEGLVMGLKEIGLKKFHFVEADNFPTWNTRGYVDINMRHGIVMNEPDRRPRDFRDGRDIHWAKVTDGVIFKRIPYYTPVNEPDTWLLNISKWKAHAMCLTQAVKNEQGLVVGPFVAFCSGWKLVTGAPDYMKAEINPKAEALVNNFFERHTKMGYQRYASKTRWVGPITQEIWAHKTCDNASTLRTGLSIVEGIYGRDGDGFGYGTDYLTNMVMFSKDKFRLDVIGLYLGGHEPGNVGLYRIAKERGLTDTFNPWEIPVFEWEEGGRPVPRKLADFTRTPLKSNYLPLENEPHWHLTNEPFDYDKYKS